LLLKSLVRTEDVAIPPEKDPSVLVIQVVGIQSKIPALSTGEPVNGYRKNYSPILAVNSLVFTTFIFKPNSFLPNPMARPKICDR